MKIEFLCEDPTICEFWHPVLATDIIPPDIKNLPEPKNKYGNEEIPIENIKTCPPSMDMASSGYIIKNSIEFTLTPSFQNFQQQLSLESARVADNMLVNDKTKKIAALYNYKSCPLKSQSGYYFKYTTEWGVKTPQGYSCLILQPFVLNETRYTVIPSIIDTDVYHKPIPLVGYLNTKDIVRLRPGDPVLQVIPFKRDDWEMIISNEKIIDKGKFYLWNSYKKIFHKVKKFK